METDTKYLQVMISAEMRTQGMRLLDHLLRKRLIFGGPVLSGPARFLWKNEIVEHDYSWIISYTRADLRDEFVREAELHSVEEYCMISFAPLDPTPALQSLLDAAFDGRETAPPIEYTDAVVAQIFVPFADVHQRTVLSNQAKQA